jgi:hypothetical protein
MKLTTREWEARPHRWLKLLASYSQRLKSSQIGHEYPLYTSHPVSLNKGRRWLLKEWNSRALVTAQLVKYRTLHAYNLALERPYTATTSIDKLVMDPEVYIVPTDYSVAWKQAKQNASRTGSHCLHDTHRERSRKRRERREAKSQQCRLQSTDLTIY